MKAIRWSDNDHYFGPFTYARENRTYRPIALVLGSGDGDDYPHCRLRLSAFGCTIIVRLPQIIKPSRTWVDTSKYEWAKGPGSGFWDIDEREYGFTYSDGFLHVKLGRQTNDSSTQQDWGWHLPWTQWRHVRHSLYGLDGALFAHVPKWNLETYGKMKAIEEACPSATFAFADFDGEELTATTRIEEREWRFGEGKFKWLSLFRKPKIERSLGITFSGETGKRKGSWKGGTIGHSIGMRPGELHEAAFRRYCAEHEMTFRGQHD